MSDYINHLGNLDHGTLADLLGDVKTVELVEAVMRNRDNFPNRGEIILALLGGPSGIIEDPHRRKKFFISLNKTQENELKSRLSVENLYNLRLSDGLREILYTAFGDEVPQREKEKITPAVDAVSVNYGLFYHQSEALKKCKEYLNGESKRVLLHMPTGSGKTRTAMHLICQQLNLTQTVVVWLVSGRELCEQAVKEFQIAWKSLGERPLPLIRIWGGLRGVDTETFPATLETNEQDFSAEIWPMSLKDGMVVASLDSINTMIDRWQPREIATRKKNVSLVVFDEAHRSPAKTYKRAVESLLGRGGLLGLSATPGRRHHGETGKEDQDLVELFGTNKVVLEIPGFESPVEGLIQQGYLARLEHEQLRIATSKFSPSQLRDVRQKLSQSLELNENELRAFGLDGTRNLQVIDCVEKLVKDEGHKRLIVFTPSVEASRLIANVLESIGIAASSVTAKTPTSEREKIISEYRSTQTKPLVLCNFNVLTTGFDVPSTSAVVIARPTPSIILLSQMAGRAVRGPNVGGNKKAKLVTVADTSIPELIDTIEQFHAFDNSWDAPS